jgi:hypothetical protein
MFHPKAEEHVNPHVAVHHLVGKFEKITQVVVKK